MSALNNKGHALHLNGDLEYAETCFNEALKLDKKYIPALNYYGFYLNS